MTSAFIRRLTLSNFRSYHAAQIELGQAGPVVLTGANGAGKTNLIEAISMLAPGRGLRRATMEELAFADHLRVVWLVPAMDPLFNGPASERRRFLDRLVLAVDAQHSSRVAALGSRAVEQRVHGRHQPHHAQMIGEGRRRGD